MNCLYISLITLNACALPFTYFKDEDSIRSRNDEKGSKRVMSLCELYTAYDAIARLIHNSFTLSVRAAFIGNTEVVDIYAANNAYKSASRIGSDEMYEASNIFNLFC